MSSTGRAEAAPAYDPKQRFLQLIGGGNGVIYAVQADGGLIWYRHANWATATPGFVSGSGRRIDSGWNGFETLMGSLDGSIYALRADGTLRYYKYVLTNPTTGAGSFTVNKQIGSGFGRFSRVFGFNGNIYGVDESGRLYWYRYNPGPGTWTYGSGKYLGDGFSSFVMHADAQGVIYTVRFGRIAWHRHTDAGAWYAGSGTILSSGFSELALAGLHFTGNGSVYAVRPDLPDAPQSARLFSWRLSNYLTVGADRRPTWVNGGRDQQVGAGWTVYPNANLQGYALTRSVKQGEEVKVAVSAGLSSYTHSIVRVAPAAGDPQVVRGPQGATGGIQTLPQNYFSNGCGWSPSLSFTADPAWTPGLYAVRLGGPLGLTRHVPFVVRPAEPSNPIAVILPNLTYNAYNEYGNHSQYCGDLSGRRLTSLNRPSNQEAVMITGRLEHTMGSDILLTRWMTKQGLAFDCYYDTDLHASGDWTGSYRAIVLGSHPEYFTETMRQNLINYQAAGGTIIYTGGNGIYERVYVDLEAGTSRHRRADGSRDVFSVAGMPASQIVAVNYTSSSWYTFAPYKVERNHAILQGTGLGVGSLFGRAGYNGAASGWETDIISGLPNEAPPSEVIARGQNAKGGACMVFHETGQGGFVFSASSISFNGALAVDAPMSRLLKNVFDMALARPAVASIAPAPMPKTRSIPAQPEHDQPM